MPPTPNPSAPEQQPNLWGIHAGAAGEADSQFLTQHLIALGWKEMGDLAALKGDREGFRQRMAVTYPAYKPAGASVTAGQLFRFVYEVQIGDIVVYPSKKDRLIHLGRVAGGYQYKPDLGHYAQIRPVKWLKVVPRTGFSQGAIYEIGAGLSLFAVKNYAEEFRAALDGKTVPVADEVDSSIALVTAGIEEATRDFILKRLAAQLKGHPLAYFVAHLLGTMGYRSHVSPPGTDGGVDIIAHKDELGFEPPIVKVQVKSSNSSVGQPEVASLVGALANGEFALVVTLGAFTPPAKTFARGRSDLQLIDGARLVELILQHYEQFDSLYKGIVPLKKVYVPEGIEHDAD